MEHYTPDYPEMIVPVGHVEPVPRRIRGYTANLPVFDTVQARCVWLWPGYPQYCIPRDDIRDGVLLDEDRTMALRVGRVRRHSLRLGALTRPGAAWEWTDDAPAGISGHVSFRWEAIDAWFEKDEQVFVHPRSPYTRVDALRSGRSVRVLLDGAVLADAPYSVMALGTGLPRATTSTACTSTGPAWSPPTPSPAAPTRATPPCHPAVPSSFSTPHRKSLHGRSGPGVPSRNGSAGYRAVPADGEWVQRRFATGLPGQP